MTKETKHFKMKSTQTGVQHGDIHPVVFQKDKTYKLDESLQEQWKDHIEPSHDEPVDPTPHGGTPTAPDNWVAKEPLNENVLDEDPAVLRHAEIPVEAVHAQNDAAQANGDMTPEAEAALGRAPVEAVVESEEKDDKPHAKPKADHKTKK